MKISANEIKTGMIIEHNNDLWEVLKTQHVKPGKGGAFNQVELKSINKNTKLNERFRSNDTIEKAILDEKKHNFLFEDSENYHFMDQVSYEQILIKKSKIGEKGKLLKENTEVTINFYDDIPLSVDLPITINCKIIRTDASLKGQTVSSSYKPAIIENDIKIQVPPFIDTDDEILIDTRTLEYLKKIQ
jgi:elongation factor P